jgi:hypothetical protein
MMSEYRIKEVEILLCEGLPQKSLIMFYPQIKIIEHELKKVGFFKKKVVVEIIRWSDIFKEGDKYYRKYGHSDSKYRSICFYTKKEAEESIIEIERQAWKQTKEYWAKKGSSIDDNEEGVKIHEFKPPESPEKSQK